MALLPINPKIGLNKHKKHGMTAEIITIGDEILIGQIVDTNSAFIAEELNKIGITVHQISSVSDDNAHILTALAEAESRVDLVLMTGGLGPTKDDITKKCLATYFNCKLSTNAEVLADVRAFIAQRGVALQHNHEEQAMVPSCCTALRNKIGTAPGIWFQKNNTIFVSMPGVPSEMRKLIEDEIIPRLLKRSPLHVYHKTVLTTGFSESAMAQMLEPLEEAMPASIKLAYLPSPGQIRLRFSTKGTNKIVLEETVEAQIDKLKKILPEKTIFGYNNESLASSLQKICTDNKLTFATAESCTGGYIAHLVTTEAGGSAYFAGAAVTYSNQAKINSLGVKPQTIDTYGAVSEQTVSEMAEGIRSKMGTDISVATSGIAGPNGGTDEKPVGTVWIAVSTKRGTKAKKFNFGKLRERNIKFSALTALNIARLEALELTE